VLEAGLGMSAVVWGLVQPLVAARTRSVVYDRAGIGRSDDAAGPRTLDVLAADLGALLDALGGPFVLVGHSWGGPIVRVAASSRQDVRALVLVDPTDEHDAALATRAARRSTALAGPVTLALAATGLYRRMDGIGAPLPPETRRRFREEDFGRRAARQLASEVRSFLPDLARLRAAPPDLGATPVTVLSAGGAPSTRRAHARSLGEQGRLLAVDDAGHDLLLTRPEVVAAEILRFL
jgi:pimeloyl-ACP methyl ester carboxylesterase